MSPTSINIPKTHTDITRKNPTDTSYMEYLTKYYSIRKKSHTPIYTSQENMIPHTKLLLLKYIHQYLDILPYIRPGDTTDEKQKCRSDRKFIPEELHNIFVCWRLWNQSNFISVTNRVNLSVGVSPPPPLGDFTTIPKTPKGKTISLPIKFSEIFQTGTGYVDWFSLEVHHYILSLVDIDTCYT